MDSLSYNIKYLYKSLEIKTLHFENYLLFTLNSYINKKLILY